MPELNWHNDHQLTVSMAVSEIEDECEHFQQSAQHTALDHALFQGLA